MTKNEIKMRISPIILVLMTFGVLTFVTLLLSEFHGLVFCASEGVEPFDVARRSTRAQIDLLQLIELEAKLISILVHSRNPDFNQRD